MRRKSYLLLVILIAGALAGLNSAEVSSASSSPTLNDIWFDQSYATDNDVVNVFADVSDADNDVNYVEFELLGLPVNSSDHNRYLGYHSMQYNSSAALWQGNFTVTQYWPSTTLNISYVGIGDDAGNWVTFSSWDGTLESPQMTLDTSNPDYTAPELHDIWFDASDAEAGQSTMVYANVTDAKSGVRSIWADIYRYNDSATNYWEEDYVDSPYLSYNTTTELYQGTWQINEFLENGTYHIPVVSTQDYMSNNAYYENSTNAAHQLNSPRINITNYGEIDSNPPELHDFGVMYDTVETIDDQIAYANISDDLSGLDYAYFDYYYYNTSTGYEEYVGYSYFSNSTYNDSTGYYQTTVWADDYVPANTSIYIGYIGLQDVAGNNMYLQNGTDYQSPTFTVTNTLNDTVSDGTVEVGIATNSGNSTVGEEIFFDTSVYNNQDNSTTGDVFFDIYGAENQTIFSSSVSLSSYEDQLFTIPVTFNVTGDYTIVFSYSSSSEIVSDSITWSVYNETTDTTGYIDLNISPQNDVSNVGEGVLFNVSMTNYYNYSIGGNVSLWAHGPDIINSYDNYHYLYSGETESISDEIFFQTEGEYVIQAIFYADDGLTYSYNATWFVNASSDDGTDTEEEHVAMNISPQDGVNDVGQPVLFTVNMTNYYNYSIGGNVTLEITGPDNFAIDQGYFTLDVNQTVSFSEELYFDYAGDYVITAFFYTDNSGPTYSVNATWTVNSGDGPHGDEYIKVHVSPDGGQSVVNESVTFDTNVTSTFTHDMPNVTLVIDIYGQQTGFNYSDTIYLNLPAQTSIIEQFVVQFTQVDSYYVNVTLYDDIGAPWNFDFYWDVIEEDQDTTDEDTSTDTFDSTDTVTNGTDTASNSSALPEVSLPGFELYLSVIGFTSLLIVTYQRRRLSQ